MAQIIYNRNFPAEDIPYEAGPMLEYFISHSKHDALRLIVPTGRLMRRIKFGAIRYYYKTHNKPAPKFEIFTFYDFVRHCAGKMLDLSRYHFLSDAYRFALFEEAIKAARLNFYKRSGQSVSTALAQKIADVIYGLRQDGITPADMAKELDHPEITEDEIFDESRMADIAAVYKKYLELLGDKYLDQPGLLQLINSFLGDPDQPRIMNPLDNIFNENDVIFLDEFSEFRRPEIEFLAHFRNCRAGLGLNIDYHHDNGPLYGNLTETIVSLKGVGFGIKSTDKFSIREKPGDESEFPVSGNTEYMRTWLFNTEKEIRNPNFSEIINIYRAEDKIEEVNAIARLIKYLCIEKDYHVSDICITTRRQEKYTDIFREVFFSANIPYNVSDRFSLAKSPVVVAVFSMLDMISREFRAGDVHRTIESRFLDISARSKNGDIDTANLFTTAAKLRIIGGPARGGAGEWHNKLSSATHRLEKEIELLSANSYADTLEIHNLENELEAARKALDDFEALTRELPAAHGKFTPEEFADFVKYDIITKYRISENITELYDQAKSDPNITTDTEFLFYQEMTEKNSRALNALVRTLDEMVYIMCDRHGRSHFSLKDLTERFRTAVQGTKYQIREKQNFGVTVTSIEQTRAIPYKVMILCGALDGDFPMAYRSERFLGKELFGSETRHFQSERLLFYQFLTNAPELINSNEKLIYITYPKKENERETVRSSFIDELLKITTLEDDCRIFDLGDAAAGKGFEWLNSVISSTGVLKRYCEAKAAGTDSPEAAQMKEIAREYGWHHLIEFQERASERDTADRSEAGLIIEEMPDRLREQFIQKAKGPLSITDLETYAKCPYHYFVHKLLEIKPPEEPELALSPLEKGSLLHRIAYKFYTKLQQEESGQIFEATDSNLPSWISVSPDAVRKDYYRDLIKSIAREEIERVKFEHPFFALEENKILGNKGEPGYIDIWLERELRRRQSGWPFVPGLFEFSFGMGGRSKSGGLPPMDFGGKFALRGKIDRIELDFAAETPRLIVVDYKTTLNNIPSNNKIIDGKSFQMPLYLAAAKRILAEKYGIEAEPAFAAYFAFKPDFDKNKTRIDHEKLVLVDRSEGHIPEEIPRSKLRKGLDIDSAIETSINHAADIVSNIRAGKFPVEPDSNACRYCKYQTLCRIGESDFDNE
jgi:ATP-dependent helicase/nuclease subunit B